MFIVYVSAYSGGINNVPLFKSSLTLGITTSRLYSYLTQMSISLVSISNNPYCEFHPLVCKRNSLRQLILYSEVFRSQRILRAPRSLSVSVFKGTNVSENEWERVFHVFERSEKSTR